MMLSLYRFVSTTGVPDFRSRAKRSSMVPPHKRTPASSVLLQSEHFTPLMPAPPSYTIPKTDVTPKEIIPTPGPGHYNRLTSKYKIATNQPCRSSFVSRVPQRPQAEKNEGAAADSCATGMSKFEKSR